MHWFWRGATAAVAGGLLAFLATCLAWVPISLRLLQFRIDEVYSGFAFVLVPITVYTAISLKVYHTLTCEWAEAFPDNELRCRKCQYILRGLTKPRCPECGEAI